MIIYNTTFHIQKEIVAECLEYLKNTYIPNAIEGKLLSEPCLRRILHSEDEEGENYSVQFNTKDMNTLNKWIQSEGAALQQELVKRYKEKIVGFSTLLEDIDLSE